MRFLTINERFFLDRGTILTLSKLSIFVKLHFLFHLFFKLKLESAYAFAGDRRSRIREAPPRGVSAHASTRASAHA